MSRCPIVPLRAAGDQMRDADVSLLTASTSSVWSDFSEWLMIKSMRHLFKTRKKECQNIFRAEAYRLNCRAAGCSHRCGEHLYVLFDNIRTIPESKSTRKWDMVLFRCHFHSLSAVSPLWFPWKQNRDLTKTLRYNDQCINWAVLGTIRVVKSTWNSYYWFITPCRLLSSHQKWISIKGLKVTNVCLRRILCTFT